MNLNIFVATLSLAVIGLMCDPGWARAEQPPDAGGVGQRSLDVLRDWGLLDVTSYGALPDDEIDDTTALQRAIDDARDNGLVAFFPGGVYLVSDTLRAVQKVRYDRERDRWMHNRREANALSGSTVGKRPVLKLSQGAKGFDDPNKPKPLVWIWSQSRDEGRQGSPDPDDEQPNISFNQVFKGIDIDVRGSGNAGAVGIRHAGSQGSTLQDVVIWAHGAFAGIYNPPGQGGGVYKVAVEGGRYGVWADNRARYPVLAGVRFKDQEEAAIFWRGQSNLTMAGFEIEKSIPGPVITAQKGGKAYSRSLTLVDGVIRGAGELAIDNREGRNLYLKDVRVSGFAGAIESRGRPAIKVDGSSPSIAEYVYTGQGSRAIMDGRIREAQFESFVLGPDGVADPIEAIVARHLWAPSFPSFEDGDAVSVKSFGARGDDSVDDTEAFRAAIAKHPKVFVPKGTYLLRETLVLGSDTHLFGVAKHLSILEASPDWKSGPGNPLITTDDKATAKTTVSFLMLSRPRNMPSLPLLEWRAGRASAVRDLVGGLSEDASGRPSTRSAAGSGGTFAIRGNGGGRWYGLSAEWNRMSPDTEAPGYRHLAIERTREPLAMYGLNIERGLADPQMEIRGASNIAIYYLKGETLDGKGGPAGILRVTDGSNIAVFGYSGNARPFGKALISVRSSNKVLLANLAPVGPDAKFDTVSIQEDEKTISVDGRFPVSLVRFGEMSLQF